MQTGLLHQIVLKFEEFIAEEQVNHTAVIVLLDCLEQGFCVWPLVRVQWVWVDPL